MSKCTRCGKNPENKCEKAGFEHAWENTTPNFVYPTCPPRYPCKQETCRNCGLIRYYKETVKKWIEYSDGIQRSYELDGSVTIIHEPDCPNYGNLTFASKE